MCRDSSDTVSFELFKEKFSTLLVYVSLLTTTIDERAQLVDAMEYEDSLLINAVSESLNQMISSIEQNEIKERLQHQTKGGVHQQPALKQVSWKEDLEEVFLIKPFLSLSALGYCHKRTSRRLRRFNATATSIPEQSHGEKRDPMVSSKGDPQKQEKQKSQGWMNKLVPGKLTRRFSKVILNTNTNENKDLSCSDKIRINFIAKKSGKKCFLVLEKSDVTLTQNTDGILRKIKSKLHIKPKKTISFAPTSSGTQCQQYSTLAESLQTLENGATLYVST